MTGPISVQQPPSDPSDAIAQAYVDARPIIGDNRIINGDMRIDQRNNGASGTATGVYTVDRWSYSANQASKGTWQRGATGANFLSLGFGYILQFTSSSAYASVASDYFQFMQPIEADMIADFAWGTPQAQPITLSFLVSSTLTGTFSGAIRNNVPNRSYPFTFSVPVANTPTKIAVTIPGDTSGSWVLQGNGVGLYLNFDLGCGSTLRGPANAWASADYHGATGVVSVVGTNAATFNVTGVKLEIGSAATPFNRQSLAKSMADCQRYYQAGQINSTGYMEASTPFNINVYYNTFMRAAPTITLSNMSSANLTGSFNVSSYPNQAFISATTGLTAYVGASGNWAADAEL